MYLGRLLIKKLASCLPIEGVFVFVLQMADVNFDLNTLLNVLRLSFAFHLIIGFNLSAFEKLGFGNAKNKSYRHTKFQFKISFFSLFLEKEKPRYRNWTSASEFPIRHLSLKILFLLERTKSRKISLYWDSADSL